MPLKLTRYNLRYGSQPYEATTGYYVRYEDAAAAVQVVEASRDAWQSENTRHMREAEKMAEQVVALRRTLAEVANILHCHPSDVVSAASVSKADLEDVRGADAMLRAVERIIPRNDAHRDYAETVQLFVESCRANATRHQGQPS